jgi:Winged helix-turn helix
VVKCTKSQIRKLKTALRWKMPAAQRERIQMVLLRESGMTQPAIAEAMGVLLSTVKRAHMAYDGGGIKALKPKPIGGRQRDNMTFSGEKALLACFTPSMGIRSLHNRSRRRIFGFLSPEDGRREALATAAPCTPTQAATRFWSNGWFMVSVTHGPAAARTDPIPTHGGQMPAARWSASFSEIR